MKNKIHIFQLIILTFLALNTFAIKKDSLFIEAVKQYFHKETGMVFLEHYFTEVDSTLPDKLLYVSYSNKIESPYGIMGFFNYTDKLDLKYKSMRYETFCYSKSYANANAKLSERFLSYPNEAQVFVILHELMHNYIRQFKFKRIPYDFEEALCDIIGNYGSLDFAETENLIDLNLIKRQILLLFGYNDKTNLLLKTKC